MKPLNKFFGVLYTLFAPVVRLLFPADVEGLENVPPSGVLFCPNHAHDLDPLVIAACLPRNSRLHFMGKAELFKRICGNNPPTLDREKRLCPAPLCPGGGGGY